MTRSQVGAVPSGEESPRSDRSRWGAVSGGGQHFAFFLSSPDLISYVSNLVWVFRGVVLVFWAFSFEKAPKAVGVSHDVQRAQMCVFCQ